MCQAIIDMKKNAYDDGFQKGEESGFQKGAERTVTSIVRRMLNAKYDVQEISKMTGVTVQTIDQISVAQGRC